VLQINKTVYPDLHRVAHIEVVDALQNMAEIGGIKPDDAQYIFAEAFKFHGSNGADSKAKTSNKKTNGGDLEPLPFIDMSKWDDEPAPPRQWAVQDRIPLRQPTLFSGEGAIGKTLLALQLSVAHVLGRDWLGMLPVPGPAIYFGAEDGTDELHRRLADIATHYGTTFAELKNGGLRLLSFAGKDAVLGAASRNGIIEPTPLFYRVHKAACEIQPKTIVLDTSADIYAGNENDRMQVRQFVGLLRRLAMDGNCAVLLCSHPSLTGISTGSGLSGSTGWHNSVRARIFFKPATTD
jgi:RecA-family ATPase